MSDETGKAEAAQALALIEAAFAERPRPTIMTDSLQLSDVEYAEVMSFDGLAWPEVTFAQAEADADAVFWFAPEAFCYYLPGLLAAGLKENRTDTNAYDALIGMLDRSPEPDWWDDFFGPRWTLLGAAELDAVAAWVRWLAAVLPDAFHANSYERALATLALLKERQAGG
jgi:hypothetical protein